MAEEIAALKQLQAGLNASFEALFAIAEKEPTNVKAFAQAKEQIAGLSSATASVALGPASSAIGLSATVGSDITV